MHKLGLWLLLIAGVVCGVYVWQPRQTACEQTLRYRLGNIDRRFGISEAELREAISMAAALWETPGGANLFAYDPAAPLAINLVFDGRQHATVTAQNLVHKLKQTRVSHTKLSQLYTSRYNVYNARLQAYQEALSTYEERLRTYNAEVQRWNSEGGAPIHVYRRLEREKQQLDRTRQFLDDERSALQDVVAMLHTLEEQEHTLVNTYKRQAQTYNALYGTTTHFHKGEYDGTAITVYQFHDAADLILVLAHELGHALGVGHVKDPNAVMHAFMGEQDLAHLTLTTGDLHALRSVCGQPE